MFIMKNKKVLLIVVLGILGITGWFAYQKFFNRSATMDDFAKSNNKGRTVLSKGILPIQSEIDPTKQQAFYCPKAEDLVLKKTADGIKWATKDDKWQTYTPTLSTKIMGFIGAQWQGIKVGSVICLYNTNEAVPFPAALEQKLSQLVLEPKNIGGWSAHVDGGRGLCISTNIAVCPYYVQETKDIKDFYQEIKYAPDVSSYSF
jgi:hypothetical protein